MKIKFLIILIIFIQLINSAKIENYKSLSNPSILESTPLISKSSIPNRLSDHNLNQLPTLSTLSRTEEKSSFTTKLKDYFHETSKKNQSTAMSALGGFIAGIVLFILSIQLICYNERRAVKDNELLDYYRDHKKCEYVENVNDIKINDENKNKLFLINGEITVRKEAKFNNSNILITQPKGKIVLIKINHEYMNVEENSNNEGYSEYNKNLVKTWCYGQDLNSYIDCSEVALNDKFIFDSSLLESFTSNFIEQTYIPKDYDLPFVSEWIKPFYNGMYTLVTFNEQIYVLQGQYNPNFSPSEHTFVQNDRKLTIKFYVVDSNRNNQFTMTGKLIPGEEGLYRFINYETCLKEAGCFSLFCCCAESGDYYKIHRLFGERINREQVIQKLTHENESCTLLLRIINFFLHFASYYLILYPFILIIGMIPFFGAIGATVLVFIAFLLSCITYLFIIAIAWVFARPLVGIVLVSVIIMLVFLLKMTKDNVYTKPRDDQNYHDNRDRGFSNRLVFEEVNFLQY